MNIASTISRYLLGIMFTVFGFNGFFHFIPLPPPPQPLALQYMTVLTASHYFVPVFLLQVAGGILLQVAGGILLLINRYVPLALALLIPVIVNILLFHSLMNPEGAGAGALATILWVIVFLRFRGAFAGIFQPQPLLDAL